MNTSAHPALRAVKITPIRPEPQEPNELAVPFTERAYIAALFRDPDGKKLIAEGITVDHFTSKECANAFLAVTLFLDDGIQPDAATIAALVDSATMIEIETSLRENASAANRAHYVTVLKDYRLKRQIAALNSQIAAAASAGQPPTVITALVEQIEALQQPTRSASARFTALSAMNHPADIDWLIEGYIERDTITQLFGDPGSGKSFVALDMALSIAHGMDWNGQNTQRGTVFYLAGEGRRGLHRRIEAWRQQNRIHDNNAPFFISRGACAISHPDEQAALIRDIDDAVKAGAHQPPALIVIDTLARHFTGDENSTKDMSAFIAGLDAIRARYQCCILLVHHTGHADKSRARGSIALLGSLDAEYRVEKMGDATITLTSTRQKDNDNPPPLAWTLTRQDLPWADKNGKPLNSAVLVPNDFIPAAKPIKEKMGNQQRQALNALQELYRTQRKNLEDDGRDPDTARVTVADWMDAMKDISSDSSNRAKLRKWLAEHGHVRSEGPFVYLVAVQAV